jgi:hypothetical protein
MSIQDDFRLSQADNKFQTNCEIVSLNFNWTDVQRPSFFLFIFRNLFFLTETLNEETYLITCKYIFIMSVEITKKNRSTPTVFLIKDNNNITFVIAVSFAFKVLASDRLFDYYYYFIYSII